MVFFLCVFVDLTKQKNQNYETNTIYSNKQGSKIKTEKFEKINQSLNFDVKPPDFVLWLFFSLQSTSFCFEYSMVHHQ